VAFWSCRARKDRRLGCDADDTCHSSVLCQISIGAVAYRRQGGRQHCLSSWTRGGPTCRGRRYPRGQRRCAMKSPLASRRSNDAREAGGSCKGRLTPMTLSCPISLTNLSWTEPLALPWPSVLKLPRSPTWRFSSPGAPCSLPKGLTVPSHVRF
jgi:hypothetical protein